MRRHPSRRVRKAAAAAKQRTRPLKLQFDPKNFPTPAWDPKRDGDNTVPFDLYYAKRNTDELQEQMAAPFCRANDPRFDLFGKNVPRKEREAAARRMLLMKEFGSAYGSDTIQKLEVTLAAKQDFNDRPPAMLDPPSHTYAAQHQRAKAGFVQRMLYQQQLHDRKALSQRERKDMATLRKLRGVVPGNTVAASPSGSRGLQGQQYSPATESGAAGPTGRYRLAAAPAGHGDAPPLYGTRTSSMSRLKQQHSTLREKRSPRNLIAALELPTDNYPAVHVHSALVDKPRDLSPKQVHVRSLRDGLDGSGAQQYHRQPELDHGRAGTIEGGMSSNSSVASAATATASDLVRSGDFRQAVTANGISVHLPQVPTFGGGFSRRNSAVSDGASPGGRRSPSSVEEEPVLKGKTHAELVSARLPTDKRAMRKWQVETPIDSPIKNRYR